MTTTIAHPLPAGTVEVLSDWESYEDGGLVTRICRGVKHGTGTVSVGAVVEQLQDGTVLDRVAMLHLRGECDGLSAEELVAHLTNCVTVARELGIPSALVRQAIQSCCPQYGG